MKFEIIKCKLVRGLWQFKCKCGKTHIHGPGEGARHPHCDFHNPNRHTHDYYLVLEDFE